MDTVILAGRIGSTNMSLASIKDDHRTFCGICMEGPGRIFQHDGMRWKPGDGVYRAADYRTPPHTPRGRS